MKCSRNAGLIDLGPLVDYKEPFAVGMHALNTRYVDEEESWPSGCLRQPRDEERMWRTSAKHEGNRENCEKTSAISSGHGKWPTLTRMSKSEKKKTVKPVILYNPSVEDWYLQLI